MCGITAFYPKSKKKADFNIIKGIAAINDERGKDNSGIAIGNIFFQKCAVNKYIRDLISKYKTEISGLDTVGAPWILHTRASSNKMKMLEKHAHPYKWNYLNKEGEPVDYFIGCHNGYVSNVTELHKKYILDKNRRDNKATDYDVDSEVILDCLTTNLSDKETVRGILKDYTGNAALVFYTKDYFYVWKGACNGTEERPLYMAETKDGWYFSSIEASLKMYFDDVILVPHNSLTTFHKNKLLSQEIIERKVIVQTYTHPVTQRASSAYITGFNLPTPISLYFRKNTLDWHRVAATNPIVMEGNYYSKDVIGENTVQDGKSATHYIPVSFINGVAVKRLLPTLEVAIHQLINCDSLEMAKTIIRRHKDVILENMIGFVPIRMDENLIGAIIKVSGELAILDHNEVLTSRFFGKKIEIVNQKNIISASAEPFKQTANV